MRKCYILAEDELSVLAKDITKEFKSGVILLRGDLASGKTTLVKEIAKTLHLADVVTSPTFALQQVYGGVLYHYDIYNHGLDHFISLGLLEELEKDALHIVEWGDARLEQILEGVGIEYMVVEIEKKESKREYNICTR
ncbi:MAG: tRNA (adenosine(37)-N6)-threonylcarbamoyltransferase complex ATPase subunit type 1 TsaE [Sulfuricurvum sp.]|jgi:tRNA threonylcarbamoyladenosine biosynthesis protein TsaE